MALTLGDNFSYQGSKPLDGRLKYDTLAAMKAVADATMYDGCMAYCVGTDKTYQWKSSNTVDADTGKWREFSSGGGGASALDDLTDVTITSATSGQVLKYNGSGWVNGEGGSGGTTDYSDLTNKPSINSVTLSGNKTLSELDIQKNMQLASTTGAQSKYVGRVYQYLGEDTTDAGVTFTHGNFYECYYDTSSSTYKWKRVNVQPVGGYSAGNGINITNDTVAVKEFESGDMDDVIPELPSVGARYHVYSTTEQVVGEWLDGSKIYQVTFSTTMPTVSTEGTGVAATVTWATIGISAPSLVIDVAGFVDNGSGTNRPINCANASTRFTSAMGVSTGISITSSLTAMNNKTAYITIQYTKA